MKDNVSRFNAILSAVHLDGERAATLLEEDPTLIDARNVVGESALHYFVVEVDLPSVQWLLQRGANLNTRNNFGSTPLIDAARLGYLQMCEFLLSRGADLELRNVNGETAISAAATSGQQAVLEMLLGHLPPRFDISSYFDSVEAEMALKKSGPIADLLVARGLKGYSERYE